MWFYKMSELGYNYRISDINCALGAYNLNQLENLFIKGELLLNIIIIY